MSLLHSTTVASILRRFTDALFQKFSFFLDRLRTYVRVYVCVFMHVYVFIYVCIYVCMYVFLVWFIACSISAVIPQALHSCIHRSLTILQFSLLLFYTAFSLSKGISLTNYVNSLMYFLIRSVFLVGQSFVFNIDSFKISLSLFRSSHSNSK